MQSVEVRSVDLSRGPGGFGFTLSSQGPCVLSCILASSPAHKAGLRPGDQILYVNGSSVEKSPHEQVVKLIARSPNGIVSLGVRNRADSSTEDKTTAQPESHDLIEKENADKENILNSVDKVVEELKSGQLSVHKQTLLRHGASHSNEQVINEDEIVSDEELKASFTETLQSESSSDSVFIDPKAPISNHQRASESDCGPTYDSNRLRYPVLVKHNNNNDSVYEADLTAVVGYLGSIELPLNSSLQTASLNAIRSCVRRLRAQQKIHVILLLEVSTLGIRLIDNSGKNIVTYPIQSLAFTGVCADDKKVFGVVTKKVNESPPRPNSWHASDTDLSQSNNVTYSCHVFTVDPELSPHEKHTTLAQRFHIECKRDNGKCEQFLDSSSPILHSIDNLFINKNDGSDVDGKALNSHPSDRSTSSDNDTTHSYSQTANNQDNDVNHITKGEVVNECVMKTPKHRIHVTVTDNPEMVQTFPEDEPFRHRVVQIERVQSFTAKKNIPDNKENTKDHPENSIEKDEKEKERQNGEEQDKVEIIENLSPSYESSPDSQMSVDHDYNNENSFDTKRSSNSHLFGNAKIRLSHSAEDLAQHGYENAVSRSSNLDLSSSIRSSSHSIHSVSSVPGDMPSIDGRVARWALGFDKLMDDPIGLKCFQEFLKKEFSEENIVFWIACEEFEKMTTPKELKAEAKNIFDAHLSSSAIMPVNIDSSAVKLAEEKLANPTSDMYRLQQQQVYTLMKFDSYPRFLKSDVYRQCLVADMEGLPLPYDDEKPAKSKSFKKRSTRGWGRRSSKKSTSSYDEPKTPGEKKRSFLPWKGKQPKGKGVNRPFDSQPSSTRSSLSSLSDSFPSHSNESLEVRRESDVFQFCRVVLPDHSSTIMTAKQGQSMREALTLLCERRQMSFVATEVFISGTDRAITTKELEGDMSVMAGKEISLEHRTLFRVGLPKGMVFIVKAKPDQSIRDSVEPILRKCDIDYSTVIARVVGCEVPLDSGVPVASIEHQFVVIETNDVLTANNNGPPKINIKPPVGFSSPQRGSRRGSSVDDSIFEDIIRGKKQSLGNGYFDDAGVWVPGLKPFRSQESLNDDSFGKSFLRGPGLFARKRKELTNKSLTRSDRQQVVQNKKNTEVTELLDLLTRAQGNRMNDQRGELGKNSFELPDFLRLPQTTEAVPGNETTVSPVPPPPPLPPVSSSPRHTTGSLKLRGETRPVVRKTMSMPANHQGDLMSELADKLRRRSTSEDTSIPEGHESEDSGSATKRSDSSSSSTSPWEPRAERYRRINTVRTKSCTDGAVFTVEAVTPVRLDRPMSPTGVTMSHSESMPDALQSRSYSTQSLTVNSIRGLPSSTGNINNRINEHSDSEKNVRVLQSVTTHKYNTAKQRTLSSSSEPDYSRNRPYVYEVTAKEDRPKSQPVIKRRQSDGVSTSKGNLSPFHLPQINSRKTEVFVPSTPGIKPYRIISSESKSRPKPITDTNEVKSGLDDIPPIVPPPPPCDLPLSPTASSSPRSDRNSTSPLPLPPSPVPDNVGELDVANFPPPTPLSEEKGAYTPQTTPIGDRTLTPGTNERTFVAESADDGTPYGPHTDRRNKYKPGRRANDDSWSSSSKGKEIPLKLDPYVTYESDDMRITFV